MSESDMTALVRQNLTVQKLIQETVMNRMEIGEAEIRDFYDKNAAGMVRPEAVEASLIVVKSAATDPEADRAAARRRIQQALDRVNGGEAFADVARSLSEDGTASGGGALGWVPRGVMIPEIETVLFALEVGRTSGIVETPVALHVLKVTARRPTGRMSLEEARTGIAEILKQQKSAETLQRMVADLRATARIEIY
jgi:peptidyl-prolyl cis-trans isomerase C